LLSYIGSVLLEPRPEKDSSSCHFQPIRFVHKP
jgi:hypothetical protein